VDEAGLTLNASDLRQYVYCPRIAYFRYCVPVRPPPTYKMVEGRLQHERVQELEHRRSLRAYGLEDGERIFDVRLHSERLGIVGALDLAILRRHEVIPVELKHAETRARRPRADERRPRVAWASGERSGEGTDSEEEPTGGDLIVELHHKYQLAAYALLAEERWEKPARRCFVYFVAARRAAEVEITGGVRRYTERLLRELRGMIVAQRMPEGTRRVGRCQECEYRRFCNDVD
jgi:CRISPR-associated exonuclease Cas4